MLLGRTRRRAGDVRRDLDRRAATICSSATDLARRMVMQFGMSARVGQVSFEKDPRSLMMPPPGGASSLPRRVQRPDRARDRRRGPAHHRRAARPGHRYPGSQLHEVLLRAAQVLLAKETISGQELRDMLAASEPAEEPAAEHTVSDVHAI